ncbi:hypothetical protein F8388_015453 [Cannabis sativa]|uniref:peroxidase n=1 Tax=Cannabis sativa TaxID=3483 RepID=A0A7J6GI66_CANSA|nr:hypothetical protein F8388_015453 [Cannabis sativa]
MKMSGLYCFVFITLGLTAFVQQTQAQLQMGFYSKSCPQAEKIVQDFIDKNIPKAPAMSSSLIRMQFHDCFVRGGPSWSVPTGRRDGRISNRTEANNMIPAPTANFTTLQTLFSNQGLDLQDLVLLSGAHTIGVSRCSSFSSRLYNFSGRGDQDPALDSEYAANLKANKCKTQNDNTTLVEMDPGSRKSFDLSYYTLVLKRRGLFQSDSALTTNSFTKSYMQKLLQGSENFFTEFAKSMEKMGRINVKTGSDGEIRKNCAVVN